MTTTRRQRVLAGVLAVLLVVLVVMQSTNRSEETGGVVAPAASPSATRAGAASGTPDVADVRLELLRPAATGTPDAGRNLFRFRPTAEPAVFRAPPPSPPVELGPAVPQGPPPPPPIALRFIGLLEAPQSTGRVAILSDGRGNVFNGKEGDIIEGRYRLLRIGADSAELAYLDGRGRQTIRLSGQ